MDIHAHNTKDEVDLMWIIAIRFWVRVGRSAATDQNKYGCR